MCYNLAIKWGMQMKIKGKTNLKTSNEVVINNKEFNGLKNDNTMYAIENNCIYELERIEHIWNYDPEETITYHERY